jgi:hypothetical protein
VAGFLFTGNASMTFDERIDRLKEGDDRIAQGVELLLAEITENGEYIRPSIGRSDQPACGQRENSFAVQNR